MKAMAKSRALSQNAVADALGVSQGMVSHWYTGRKRITLDKLADFCKLVKCLPWDIDPESVISEVFDKEEKRIFTLLRTADPARRELILEFLQGQNQAE